MSRLLFICGVFSLGISSPANACDKISPTSWLPGYTEEQAWERARTIWRDWDAIFSYQIEEKMYETASSIYVARVLPDETAAPLRIYGRTAEIEPIHAIRGDLPSEQVKLLAGLTSCDTYTGNGEGAFAPAGTLIVVFDGVDKDLNFEGDELRTLKIENLRYIPLMDEVHAWLRTLEGYISHND